MGSRAVVIVCRDEVAARQRFGVTCGSLGICSTRTGRPFFDDPAIESEVLARLRAALAASGLWEELDTDWLILDCELMPWSAKAQALLQGQYTQVGAASQAALGAAIATLEQATGRGSEAGSLLDHVRNRAALARRFVDAYRRYCWPVEPVADLKLAPFHLLATAGGVHVDRDHAWHLETLA